MRKVFIITGLIFLWVMAYMWLKSPQGSKQVDRVLDQQDVMYVQARANMQGVK
jgi:ABC-type uncharacterized transport system permease subunit